MNGFYEKFFQNLGAWVLSILSSIIIILFLYLLSPLFYIFCWGAILAFFIYPIYSFVNKKFKYRRRFSAITVIVCFLIFIIGPLSLLLFNFYSQMLGFLENLQPLTQKDIEEFIKGLQNYPYLYNLISKILDQLNPYLPQLQDRLSQILSKVFQDTFTIFKNFIKFVVSFGFKLAFTLITLYYFLIDGEKTVKEITDLIPGEEKEKEKIINRVSLILKGVLYGNILTALIQGLLAFIIYFALGIPQYLLWAFLTIIASFIPAFGTGLIWGPLVIYLIIIGNYTKALILFIYSALIIAQVDNILKPFLIGEKIKIHNLLVLFSVLGGLIKFGFLGLFLGPIILGLFLSLIEIYKIKFLH